MRQTLLFFFFCSQAVGCQGDLGVWMPRCVLGKRDVNVILFIDYLYGKTVRRKWRLNATRTPLQVPIYNPLWHSGPLYWLHSSWSKLADDSLNDRELFPDSPIPINHVNLTCGKSSCTLKVRPWRPRKWINGELCYCRWVRNVVYTMWEARSYKKMVSNLNEVRGIDPACIIAPYRTRNGVRSSLTFAQHRCKARTRYTANTTPSGIIISHENVVCVLVAGLPNWPDGRVERYCDNCIFEDGPGKQGISAEENMAKF